MRAPSVPPAPPSSFETWVSWRLFRALAPPLARQRTPRTPKKLGPSERVDVPRADGTGRLTATLFPVEDPRGVVLLLPPWMKWGRTYFHRHGRLEALRAAGYTAVIADFPGFGGSDPPAGFYHHAVEDACRWVVERFPDLPRHYWGVSSGGYWAHFALARHSGFTGAVFEDVSPHLLEWSWKTRPLGRPFYLLFRALFRRTYRYLDARRHAPHLKVERVAYVSGENDPGVRPEDTRSLAAAAGGEALVVPAAAHLEAIKEAREDVIALALATFEGKPARQKPHHEPQADARGRSRWGIELQAGVRGRSR
jgi:pimeloyl-ACP methyl ester carboxylesterase